MSFPLDSYDKIVANPQDFRLAVKVPFTTFDEHSDFPIALNSPQGDEKPLVFLAANISGRVPNAEITELSLVRVLYSPSQSLITAITGIYTGVENAKIDIAPERLEALGLRADPNIEYRFDEIKIATILEGSPLILCAQAKDKRPYFDRRFAENFDNLPWGEALNGMPWGDLTLGRLGSKGEISSFLSLPVVINELYSFYEPFSVREEALSVLWLLSTFKEVFEFALNRLDYVVYVIEARGLPFDLKDEVKKNFYRWNNKERVWWKECNSEATLEKEKWFLSRLYDPEQACFKVNKFTIGPFDAFKAKL